MAENHMNRRGFLRKSAAITLAVGGLRASAQEPTKRESAALAAPRRGPNEEIRMAVLGIRGQGSEHIKWYAGMKNVRVVTICDVDENLFAERVKLVGERPPKTETDLRRVLDDKDVDCVSIAMPNQWHALAAIWACQAGKDVYVEKPMSYNIFEGRKLIEAARKYNRIVQVGTQIRANKGRQQAMKLLREGLLGDLYMARAYIYNLRDSIGRKDDCPVPKGVHYDLWLGPAPERPFNPNRFHYQWHWNWEYGNGEIGNNGPHLTDLIIEGLNKQEELPVKIASHGGRYVWNDQGETPNIQVTNYQYADGTVVTLDVRNLRSNDECGGKEGIIFYGAKGYLVLLNGSNYTSVVDGKAGPSGSGTGAHRELAQNFFDVVRSRKPEDLLTRAEYGHVGAALCHLGNISYRLGRSVEFDPRTETFPNDPKANAMLRREYRKPFIVPEQV
jgi:predicted dehydrogenase